MARALPWNDAEILHKQLHAAFGSGRLPPLQRFVDQVSESLSPTGLRIRKVFCDGSRPSTAFLVLHSEAEEELPVSLSALRALARVSKKFSLTQLRIFEAAASHLLRTLQALLELQLMQVENVEAEPSAARLVLGPWCYAEKLRSLEAVMPDDGADGFACTRCRLPAIFNARRCGAPACAAQYHRECLEFLSSLRSPSALGKRQGRRVSAESEDERGEEEGDELGQPRLQSEDSATNKEDGTPRVCPACRGPWGNVQVRGEEREEEDATA
ncbi:conserved hypothetical protein [Neospora caninum Liverpool]|uniref:Uncharacterized protein n=1 Tax=Neospora caninum (strain Liverpool) TaxID=572307 RepID=F0VPN5_NEOCL|nr:conserved hypothetical protein [Neospora caninum Liverpool]CBZ55682.1 conserved hypothetical protein [Neospora caninum Liverpool]|eukprot:XP_003885708.1 conserved hypothetical protein [Neospora caninum Liverpool]